MWEMRNVGRILVRIPEEEVRLGILSIHERLILK
jgi:hypothetical protein